MRRQVHAASAIALAWASLLMFAAGCGDEGGPGTTVEPGGGPITLRSTGGYPPFERTVSIGEDGRAEVVSQGPGQQRQRTRRFQVPDEELEEVRAELDELDLGSLDLPEPGDCCDLVYYELSYGGETVETDIASVPDELGAVIEEINGLGPADDRDSPAPR